MAVRVAAFLIRLRSGGFMVALPDIEEAAHFLQAQETEAGMEAAAALFAANVMMETPRGRALEEASILLADLIWPLATLFMRGSPLRAPSMVEVLKKNLRMLWRGCKGEFKSWRLFCRSNLWVGRLRLQHHP